MEHNLTVHLFHIGLHIGEMDWNMGVWTTQENGLEDGVAGDAEK